jgi:hypothetical protein
VRTGDQVRLAAALAHTAPGITLRLTTTTGGQFLVGHQRADVLLDPCRFRTGLVMPRGPGAPRLLDVLTGCEVVGGAVDLGGGLYQPSHPSGRHERWFATSCVVDAVVAVAGRRPLDLPDGDLDVRLTPDPLLGVTTVRVAAGARSAGLLLDRIAWWLLSACMVEELLLPADEPVDGGPAPEGQSFDCR